MPNARGGLSVVHGNLVEMVGSLEGWWLSNRWVDALIVGGVSGGHFLAVRFRDWPTLLDGIDPVRRTALYGACAVVVSLTGTLASISVGQYLSGKGDRVVALKENFGPELGRVWRGAFLGSGSAAILFLIAFGLDSRPAAGNAGIWVFEVGALVAVMGLLRLALLFGRIVGLVVLDDVAPLAPVIHSVDKAPFRKSG